MKLIRLYATCAAFALLSGQARAQLVINELMQSNIDCIMDDLNEFPDSWVELYNAGTATENLASYSISDEADPAGAWQLPSHTVAPGACMVIYCDKEENGLHTPFRLESGKGACVYIFKDGSVVDKVENLKKQPAPNIAYGRERDGSDSWGYLYAPTPGKSNCGKLCKTLLDDPVFSREGCVTSGVFDLTLSLPEGAPDGTVIRYTTDGREPSITSPVYNAPVRIDKSVSVRAKLFCAGYLSPRSKTQSYIFPGRNLGMAVVSMATDPDYFYSDSKGIYNDRNNGENASHDWRRPVNIEIFTEPGKPGVINQLCETRVKGGASRSAPLKSLVIYANKRFGEKRFSYEFFPVDAPGLTDWKSLELRNSGNDFDYLYVRDALIQRNMGRNADLDWQPYRPTVFFINGEYKGIINLRTRTNEDYVYTFYDGLEEIDMIENWYELKSGTWDNFNSFRDFYSGHGRTFADFASRMDVGEFANLMIMELFHNNLDFPGNNIVMWRPRTPDGKWRWIAKDTDFGLGLYDRAYYYRILDWIYDNNYDTGNNWANKPEHTRLFRRLMDVPEFREMFIERCQIYMGDFLNGTVIGNEIDDMTGAIRDEFKGWHRPLFNPWWPDYDQEVAKAKRWAQSRTDFFYTHVAEYLKLGTPKKVTIDIGRQDDVRLTVNGIPLNRRWFDGKIFAGRTVKVFGIPADESKEVAMWRITIRSGNSSTTREANGPEATFTVPADATVITVESVIGENSAIREISAATSDGSVELFDLSGRRVTCDPAPGIYIRRTAGSTEKIVIR